MKNGPRRAVAAVAMLNLAYFAVEISVAVAIGSVSLLADSIDFLEDACLNTLIFFALRWHPRLRSRVGVLLAVVLLVPGFLTAWTAWRQFATALVPAALPLSVTGLGALVVNLTCAMLLAAHHRSGGSLLRAAFLSSRNDVIANIAIICAGCVMLWRPSMWPDLIVGLGILALNLDAARQVLSCARAERAAAPG